VRRARRRADEEQLVALGRLQVLVDGLDGRRLAEVDAHAVAHEVFAVELVLDEDGGVGGVEGDDDAAEGAEGRPGVDGGLGVDEVADCEEAGWVENAWFLEVLRYRQ